ncbi:MAG: phosphatase PAP2 family protein, partial [Firmicutes bacterium]|nr:phosphatase PAP2 family protein [Bacillota bacterium]
VFYVVVLAFYVGFDQFVINYRPLLIEGVLEPAYPSAHTFIFLCVMGSTMLQLPRRLANRSLAAKLQLLCAAVVVMVIVGRVLSGVHWLTDILGGLLLAAALLGYYYAAIRK